MNILDSRAKPVISNHPVNPVNPVECGMPVFSLCLSMLGERPVLVTRPLPGLIALLQHSTFFSRLEPTVGRLIGANIKV